MTRYVRLIDMKRCTGCRSCVAACYTENYHTPDAPWNVVLEHEIGSYPNTQLAFMPVNCMHCEDPACLRVCNEVGVGAISKNAAGVVLIDYDKCIGCKYCVAVCPYGVPQYSESLGQLYPGAAKTPYEKIDYADRHPTHQKRAKAVQKCTMCWHKLEAAMKAGKADRIGKDPEYTPSCDVVCPVQARVFGDLDDPNSPVARQIGAKKATQIKKEFGTGPQVYYVLEGGSF